MKQHQIIAVHKQSHTDGESALTRAHRTLQNGAALAGITKTYEPATEDGQQLPSDGTKLQTRVPVVLREVVPALVRQFDTQLTLDRGNQEAVADVVVRGRTLLPEVPVETLLFLEKRADTIIAFLKGLPVLDESEDWEEASDRLSFKTKPSEKVRTEKVPERFEKAPATDKHPAQVEILYLDRKVGSWFTTKFSGAIRADRQADLLARAEEFRTAVKVARAEANSVEVESIQMGNAIFDFLGWAE